VLIVAVLVPDENHKVNYSIVATFEFVNCVPLRNDSAYPYGIRNSFATVSGPTHCQAAFWDPSGSKEVTPCAFIEDALTKDEGDTTRIR